METLVSTLIIAFATGLLSSMISASGRINNAARENDNAFYARLEAVESGTENYRPADLKVNLKYGSEVIERPVVICGSKETVNHGLISYKRE